MWVRKHFTVEYWFIWKFLNQKYFSIFQKILVIYPSQKYFFQNFNIAENNIISVEAAIHLKCNIYLVWGI
jgi:hypothetical protein